MAVSQRVRRLLRAGTYGVCEWICEKHSERVYPGTCRRVRTLQREGIYADCAAYLMNEAVSQRT